MNIYGYKKKIKEANKELSKGERNLGTKRYDILERRIKCWRHCIQKLRDSRKKN